MQDVDGVKVKAAADIEVLERCSPSGMMAAFTRAWCTASLGMVGRSLKVFWRGWTQAPHNAVEIVHTDDMKENVPRCIVQGCSVLL